MKKTDDDDKEWESSNAGSDHDEDTDDADDAENSGPENGGSENGGSEKGGSEKAVELSAANRALIDDLQNIYMRQIESWRSEIESSRYCWGRTKVWWQATGRMMSLIRRAVRYIRRGNARGEDFSSEALTMTAFQSCLEHTQNYTDIFGIREAVLQQADKRVDEETKTKLVVETRLFEQASDYMMTKVDWSNDEAEEFVDRFLNFYAVSIETLLAIKIHKHRQDDSQNEGEEGEGEGEDISDDGESEDESEDESFDESEDESEEESEDESLDPLYEESLINWHDQIGELMDTFAVTRLHLPHIDDRNFTDLEISNFLGDIKAKCCEINPMDFASTCTLFLAVRQLDRPETHSHTIEPHALEILNDALSTLDQHLDRQGENYSQTLETEAPDLDDPALSEDDIRDDDVRDDDICDDTLSDDGFSDDGFSDDTLSDDALSDSALSESEGCTEGCPDDEAEDVPDDSSESGDEQVVPEESESASDDEDLDDDAASLWSHVARQLILAMDDDAVQLERTRALLQTLAEAERLHRDDELAPTSQEGAQGDQDHDLTAEDTKELDDGDALSTAPSSQDDMEPEKPLTEEERVAFQRAIAPIIPLTRNIQCTRVCAPTESDSESEHDEKEHSATTSRQQHTLAHTNKNNKVDAHTLQPRTELPPEELEKILKSGRQILPTDRLAQKQSGVKGVQFHAKNRAWQARWHEGGKRKIVAFPIEVHGEEKALELAIAKRTSMVKKGVVVANTAEVRGVSYEKNQDRWKAEIDCRGKRFSKCFSVANHGEEGAKRLAIEQRKRWEAQLIATGKVT